MICGDNGDTGATVNKNVPRDFVSKEHWRTVDNEEKPKHYSFDNCSCGIPDFPSTLKEQAKMALEMREQGIKDGTRTEGCPCTACNNCPDDDNGFQYQAFR